MIIIVEKFTAYLLIAIRVTELTRKRLLCNYNRMSGKLIYCGYPCPNISFDTKLEMWPNAQRDGRPAEYRWRRLFNAAKFG